MTRTRMLLSMVVGLLATTRATEAVAQSNANKLVGGLGTPLFTTVALDAVPATDNTVPHWTSAFTSSQATYPFSMVGTNPALGSTTTSVPVAMIPVTLVLADGRSLDANPTLARTLVSPIFQPFSYTSGTTQFGDAIMRAEFWASVSTTSPDWHVLLDAPTVYPTQVIDVPAGQATSFVDPQSHKLLALIDHSWFEDRVNEILNQLNLAPTTLPIFHTYNSVLTIQGSCCIFGYHFSGNGKVNGGSGNVSANGSQPVQTGIWESWVDPELFIIPAGDVDTLSHEVSEWLNDPFGNNPVPPWEFPGNAGCQSNLETGDFIAFLPNQDSFITLSGFTYHVQNEALLQWFSREVPSSAIGGAYSYPNTTLLTSPSQPATGQRCPP